MKKSILFCLVLLVPAHGLAVEKEYIREYAYQAGEFDTKYTCRVRAIDGVKTALLDELGVYVQSVVNISEDSNGVKALSHDVVALTAGVVSTKILDEKWRTVDYYVKAGITADKDEVQRAIEALRNDHKLEQALRESNEELAEARNKITRLQKELKEQKDPKTLASLNSDYVKAARDLEVEYEFQRAMKAKIEGKFEESYQLLKKLADKNYAAAQSRLGHMYERGMGREVDYQKAVRWYLKAIENGYTQAYSRLGFIYERGLGVPQSFRKAIELYQKGVALECPHAQSRLGWLYQTGVGVEKDTKKALALYRKSIADHQHGRGYARLGFLHEKGIEVEQSYGKAASLYQQAVDRGNSWGAGRLAWMYAKGLGVEMSLKRAKELALYSVRYNNPQGLVTMGYLHEEGLDVEENTTLAYEYYLKAANQNNRKAMFRIGRMYHKGIGVDKDELEAIKWYTRAAKLGHEKARLKLANL